MYRIGFGYDAHRLVEGRPLIVGGIHVPHPMGLEGHSDADVLTHALMDAILGALGKGDIGCHFPDTDPAYEGMSSLRMLEVVMGWVGDAGYRLNNMDATIVAQAPKLAPFMPAMQKGLARVMGTSVEQVSIKATTTEGMGFCGRKQGMEAFAVISLAGGGDLQPGGEDCGGNRKG